MRIIRIATFVLSLLIGCWGPFVADAQPAASGLHVGLLYPGGAEPLAPRLKAFQEGLAEHGYIGGTNVAIEVRYADGKMDRLPRLAAELVERHVSVIMTSGDLATRVVQQATSTIPIVAFTDDLIGAGLVASHARPGGNTTGISIFSPELNVKRHELLMELAPQIASVAMLWDPATGTSQLKAIEIAARSRSVRLHILEVRALGDLNSAFRTAQEQRAGAINVLASPLLSSYNATIVDLAARSQLPAIYQWKEQAEAGGLISYGPSLLATWRQTGFLVGKVLKGAKPADLPVEQPSKFELAINLKTASALGLTIPPALLARADHVME